MFFIFTNTFNLNWHKFAMLSNQFICITNISFKKLILPLIKLVQGWYTLIIPLRMHLATMQQINNPKHVTLLILNIHTKQYASIFLDLWLDIPCLHFLPFLDNNKRRQIMSYIFKFPWLPFKLHSLFIHLEEYNFANQKATHKLSR